MSEFMCQNPWLTFWGFLLLLLTLDNVILNICKATVFLVKKSEAKKDNDQNQ